MFFVQAPCDTDNEEDKDADWMTCAGQFQFLNAQLSASEAVVSEIQDKTCPNQEVIVERMIDVSTRIKDAAAKVLQTSQLVLNKIQSSKAEIEGEETDEILPSSDPAQRPGTLSDSQKRYLLLVGPNQPLLNRYPTNEAILKAGHRQCRFNPAWFKLYPHLEYSQSKDAAFCFVCSLFARGPGHERADSAWIS